MLFKVNEQLSLELPQGYEAAWETNDNGEEEVVIRAGKYLDDNGETAYEFVMNGNAFDIEDTEDDIVKPGENPIDVLARRNADMKVLCNSGRSAIAITRKTPLSFLGGILKFYGIVLSYHLSGRTMFQVAHITSLKDDPEQDSIPYKHVLAVSKAVRLNGKKADFGNISAQEFAKKLLPEFDEEENTIGNIGLKIKVNGKEIDASDESEDNIRADYIDEELHEHYTIVESGSYTTHRDADFVAQPIRMLMKQEGNQYTEEYLFLDDEEEYADYDEDKKAIELAKVFRLDKNLFDPYGDTEAMIRKGMFAKVRMLHALRSLAWTAATLIDVEDKDRDLEDLTFAELETIGEYIKEHDYLNYSDGFWGLCDHPDWHVFYVPSNYEFDSDLRYLCGKENRGGNTIFFHVSGMSGFRDTHYINELISRNEETLVDLEDLRESLITLEPVMKTIYDGFMANRDRSQPLEGPLADALTAWCALCVAAKEPFYSEEAADTPEANAGLKEPLQRPTDALPNGERDKEGAVSTGKKSKTPTGDVLDVGGKRIIEPGQFQQDMTLRSIVIPEGVEEIGERAFAYCMALETVVFPKSLRKIDKYAFMACRALRQAELQDGILEIGDHAFAAGPALARLNFPDSLQKVDKYVFGLGGDSPYTTAILSGETAKRLGDIYARHLIIDGKSCDSIQEYLGVDHRGYPLHYVSEKTPEQKMQEWMEKYGKYVIRNPQIEFEGKLFVFTGFGGSSDLDDPLVQAVISRGGQHRKSISGKTDYLVVDPEEAGEAKTRQAVEQIKKGGKIKIILKKDVEAALSGRGRAAAAPQQSKPEAKQSRKKAEPAKAKPTQIVPVLADPEDCEIDIFDCLTEYRGCEPHLILPDGLESIGTDAFFSHTTLVSVVIPEGVETVENDAFWCCEALERVTLPNSIRKIDENAFRNCEKLRSIFIPDGCEEIGADAFTACKVLADIYVPESVCEIGDDAFYTFSSDTVIHTVRGSAADAYAKENEMKVKYDYAAYEVQQHEDLSAVCKGNDRAASATSTKDLSVSADDQVLLDEIAAIEAMLGQEEESETVSAKAKKKKSSTGKAPSSTTTAVDSVETDLYIILNNEKLLGKLNRADEEFYECYAEDFTKCGKTELLRKRRQVLNASKVGLKIPKQHIDAFKARRVAERFSVATSNLFNVDNSEIDFDKKAQSAIERTKEFYTSSELTEVRRLMDQKLRDTRAEIDKQYDAIESLWKHYSGARNHIKVYLVDPATAEREEDCIFQTEQDNALVMIKMAKPGMSFFVVRLINCMAWYWNVTPQQIWEQALKNGVEDQRSHSYGNAVDIAQKAFNRLFPEVAAAAERERAAQRRAKEETEKQAKLERIRKLEREISDLEYERDNLRGLFKGGKRKKLQAQIDELQRELNILKR